MIPISTSDLWDNKGMKRLSLGPGAKLQKNLMTILWLTNLWQSYDRS